MLVIAQLLGQLIQLVKAIALQMLNVGRALLERILQSGSGSSVVDTPHHPRQHQPAKPAAKRSKKAASKTKPAARRSRAKAPAQTRTARPSGGSGK